MGRLGALPQAGVAVLGATLLNSKQLLERREHAALALQSLGPEAANAVPALSRALRERFKRRAGVPYEDQRRQQFNAFRVLLIKTLQSIGPQAKDGLPTLRQVAEEGGDVGDAAEAAIASIEGSPTEDGEPSDDS